MATFDIIEVECGTHQFTSTHDTFELTITDILNEEILVDEVVDSGYEYELEDGVYEVEFVSGVDTLCNYIYIVCGLKECLLKMMNYVWCASPGACCNDKNIDYKQKVALYRNELNRALLLMQDFAFNTNSSLFFLRDYGDDFTDIEQAKIILEKLQALVDRCGCTDEDDEWVENTNCQ